MRRCALLFSLLMSTTAFAKSDFAFVDAVHIDRSDKTFISLDVGDYVANADTITLTGTLWNQEMSREGAKPTEVSLDSSVLDVVEEDGNKTVIGELRFSTTQRRFEVDEKVIFRKLLVSEDGATIMSVSDDPGPLAIAAAIAGAAVAICTTKIVYDMLKCPEGSRMKVSSSLTAGITCESECK